MKVLAKFLMLAGGIVLCYVLLLQFNWLDIFQVQQNQIRLEEKLGKLVLEQVKSEFDLVEDEKIDKTLDSIFQPLLMKNAISTKNYELFLVQSAEVNAYALPNDKIIITTGLINFLDSADYLAAVLAHEIAHCEKKHVMKSLVTKFGLDVLLSGTGTGEVTNFLTNQAFSRKLEKEADETAVDYLESANVNPKSLAKVMQLFDVHLSSEDDISWISSHPASADRKAYIDQKINRLNTGHEDYKPVMSHDSWNKLQESPMVNLQNQD